jgi:hypothetical protein
MTGPEHFLEAERLAAVAETWLNDDQGWKVTLSTTERLQGRDSDLAAAQVHALLANAAATALRGSEGLPTEDRHAWTDAASTSAARKRGTPAAVRIA